MRLYTFINHYLSPIQQGIQTAHIVSELAIIYPPNIPQATTFYNWAQHHKTIIVLNGKMFSDMMSLVDFMTLEENPHPWCTFNESDEAMNGFMTAVGIILPEKVYKASSGLRTKDLVLEDLYNNKSFMYQDWTGEMTVGELSPWEVHMANKLNDFNLA